MTTYNINREGNTLRIGFGLSAQNDQIVRDAVSRLAAMEEAGHALDCLAAGA